MGYVKGMEASHYMTLRDGVSYQLRVNHFPPPPEFMVDVAIEAVERFNDGDPASRVSLPNGTMFRGRDYATAAEIVESFHLEPWVVDDVGIV